MAEIETEKWVIKPELPQIVCHIVGKDAWLGTDQASGGYPYSTTWKNCSTFDTVEKAAYHASEEREGIIELWMIKSITIEYVDVTQMAIAQENAKGAYEAELKLLRQKYGLE